MSKTISTLSLLAAVSVAAISGTSHATDVKPYVTAKTGLVFKDNTNMDGVDTSFKNGYVIGAAAGAAIDNFRAEGEIAYSKRKASSADGINLSGYPVSYEHSTTTYMANGYYDFKNSLPIPLTPYVGAGLGIAHSSGTLNNFGSVETGTSNDFAYQGMVGVSYDINTQNSVYTGYRYLAVAKDGIPDSHSVEAGYRYNF